MPAVLETTAWMQSRLGLGAMRDFHGAMMPLTTMLWVDEAVHPLANGVSGLKRFDQEWSWV